MLGGCHNRVIVKPIGTYPHLLVTKLSKYKYSKPVFLTEKPLPFGKKTLEGSPQKSKGGHLDEKYVFLKSSSNMKYVLQN